MEVGVHEAKTHLSKLLKRVEAGEEITIRRGTQPVARLVRATEPKRRQFGIDRGRFTIPEDFDDPLPDEILELFEA